MRSKESVRTRRRRWRRGRSVEGRLVCPWHTGTFELETGALVEPPALRGLQMYEARWQGDLAYLETEPRGPTNMAERAPVTKSAELGADKRIVFVGGGAATAAALTTLRQGGFVGTTVVIDPQLEEPVDRTSLTKAALSGDKKTSQLPLFTSEEAQVLVSERKKARALALDAKERTVRLSSGETVRFDLALLATGGVPRPLGVEGEEQPHVHTIRHPGDVDAILEQLGDSPAGKRAVIVGDSFIAFEAASSLRGQKLEVTVIARAKTPFAAHLGGEIAAALLARNVENGVVVRTGLEALRISADGVTVSDGSTMPADLVLVAIGVTPATFSAPSLKTAKDGTFAVDRDLLVSPGVWVAGDVATVGEVHIEHWRLAQQHGRTAALAMLRELGGEVADDDVVFHGVPFFWTLIFGKRLGYVGHAQTWDQTIIDGDVGAFAFLAYLVSAGEVKAVVGCGRDSELAAFAERLRHPLTLAAARAGTLAVP